MTYRRLLLIIAILLLARPVSAQAPKPVRLSPILQLWNLEEQKLELLFNVVNESEQPAAFSYIVHFRSRIGNGWKEQPTTMLGGRRSQLVRISFKPDHIRVGDYISTSVVLYGPGYQSFYDLAEQYFEVTGIEKMPDGKQQLDFKETFPGKKPVRVGIREMSRVADELMTSDGEKKPRSGRIRRKPSTRKRGKDDGFFQLLSILPGNDNVEVATESPVTATFSDSLNAQSVSQDSFFLITASGKSKNRKVQGQLVVEGPVITFKPVRKLQADTRYQVVLSNYVQSTAGESLSKTRTWFFSTRKKVAKAKLFGPEKLYLKVLVVTPRVRGINILTDTTVQLRLSGQIVPETVSNQSFYLTLKGEKIDADLSATGDTVTLKPKQPLDPGAVYTVIATPDILDTTGKGLKKHVRWQFKTRDEIRYPELEDPNILIFSTTHEPVSYVKKKQGTLKIGITAFSSLLHADVNGKRVTIPEDTKVEFDIPYRLRSKSTTFEITTFTKEGKSRKKFVINFGNKPKPRKPPFQLVSILSAANVDNINNEPSDSENIVSASKAALTVVPQYEFRLRETSILRFKGIVLREKYAKEDFKDRETSYTQFAMELEERKTFLGTLVAGIGWNFIRLNNSDFIGENEISEETFFSGTIKNRVSKTGNWQLSFEYKNKNAAEDAADVDNETDGSEISLGWNAGFALSSLKNKAKGSLALNDAIGKYQDYQSISAAYTVSFPLGNLTPSLGYSLKHKQMAIFNPAEGEKPEYTSGSLSAKLKYKLFPTTSFTLEGKNKNQASNLEDSNYTTNTVTLSMIQIF